MPTQLCFLEDAYKTESPAKILRIGKNWIELDRTVCCPSIGMSQADQGEIIFTDGKSVAVEKTRWDARSPAKLVHMLDEPISDRQADENVIVRLHWPTRYLRMRVHTALHVISIVLPYPVVDGVVADGHGSLTFEVEEMHIPRKRLTRMAQRLVKRSLPVSSLWVQKPLRDLRTRLHNFEWPKTISGGLVRAISIGNLDLQLCDGLHARNTSEIGDIEVTDIRRRSSSQYDVHISLLDSSGFPMSMPALGGL